MVNLKKEQDDQLIKHYLNGTEAAFGFLVNRYKKEIYQRIYFIVRDKISAEDILQDTLVRIVRSIKSGLYNEEGKFLPWALMIARNLCLDYKRKTRHSKH